MGYPLSNFGSLLELQEQYQQDSKIKRVFDRFKLFAIILCDPDDRSFLNELDEVFPQLDYQTGKDLLFFTFSNSNRHRVNYNRMVPIERQDDWETRRRLESLGKSQHLDDIGIADMARRFNVELRQLPVIVVTNDLCGNEAVVLNTNKKEFGYQLSQLAFFASMHRKPISLDEIDLGRYQHQSYKMRVRSTVANILTEVFAKLQLETQANKTMAEGWFEQALRKIMNTLDSLDSNDNGSMAERENLLQDYASVRLAGHRVSDHTGIISPYFISNEKMAGAEKETLVSLKTYNRFTELLNEAEEYDYMYLSSGIGRMFETELNCSIVQQMRKLVGIPMPENYMQYYPNDRNEFTITTPSGSPVNLNQSENEVTWKSISIGDSLRAYKFMLREGYGVYRFTNDFLDEWRNIKKDRNGSSHIIRRESFNDFVTAHNNFCHFLDNGHFDQLVNIKTHLKPYQDTLEYLI